MLGTKKQNNKKGVVKDIGKILVFETDNVWKIGGVLLQTNLLEQHSCFIFAPLKLKLQ